MKRFVQNSTTQLRNLDLQNILVSLVSGNFKASNLINDPRDITILCESCTLPGRQIMTLDYQTFRQPEKLPYGYINEDVTFSFLLTNDYYVKKLFDKWQNLIINNDTYRIRYQEEFVTDVVIQQLNKANLPVYGVVLKGAYPISFNSVPLDNTAENSIQKCTVTFTYEDFIVEGAVQSVVSSAKSVLSAITKLF